MKNQTLNQHLHDICTHIAGSLRCTAETNATLQNNYTKLKKNLKNELYQETKSIPERWV